MEQLLTSLTMLFILASCANSNPKDNSDTSENKLQFVEFPYFKIDTVYNSESYRLIKVTDTKSYLNPTTFNQMCIWYAYNFHNNSEYDSIKIIVNMPNRDNSTESKVFASNHISELQEDMHNSMIESFYFEYTNLNSSTKEKYVDNESLIAQINLGMAHAIESEYKNEFLDNSTWFGYDSFRIFDMYFHSYIYNKPNNAQKIIEAVLNSNNYILEEDKIELYKIIQKYRLFIENNKR